MKCATCGTGSLIEAVRAVPYTYKGEKTVIKAVKGKFCDNPKCQEVVMDLGESVRTSKEMLEFNKTVNVELTPIDLLTQVRQQFDLTQQEAAKMFGGGANAFSRYESGKTKPPIALVTLFKVLNKHPDLFQEVIEIGEGAKAKKVSRATPAKRKRRTTSRSVHA
jgi:HTH-type transcriptional regulator / antitoxin MqsA